MIIDERHEIAFLHIPKCAGTTIRSLLQAFDSNAGLFSDRVEMHPQLGMIDYVHIPLFVLDKYFPKEFNLVKKFWSFAVVRDPHSRFASSVAQRIKMYSGKSLKAMSRSDLAKEIDYCIQFLEANGGYGKLLPPSFIHFQRQSDFLFLNSDLIVKNIYSTDEMSSLIKKLKSKIGIELKIVDQVDEYKLNQSYLYRNAFFRIVFSKVLPGFIKFKRFLPTQLVNRIKAFVYVSNAEQMHDSFCDKKVIDFINKYYSADITLYEKVVRGEV